MLKIKLSRDLRKSILRGHPWVYREAIDDPKSQKKACLCQVLDKKGKALAWAIYNPKTPLALRIISTEAKPPNPEFLQNRMLRALSLRQLLNPKTTNAYRLFNGEGDGLPGMVCDIYNQVAVLQFDGEGPHQFWDQDFVANWILNHIEAETVYFKPRNSDSLEPKTWGATLENALVLALENEKRFWVNIIEGQKTGFFLDQRDNRQFVGELNKNKSLLNLFSYTGGFSVYAGVGGAEKVVSCDISKPALDLAEKSWEQNNLDPQKHEKLAVDIFDYLKSGGDKFDTVLVDPPSLTHSEKNKDQAIFNYTELFSQAAKLVKPGGSLALSSCSSHVSFNDFFDIATESLSKARRKGQIIKVSGQGMDHPFPHACFELRYLKFVYLNLD